MSLSVILLGRGERPRLVWMSTPVPFMTATRRVRERVASFRSICCTTSSNGGISSSLFLKSAISSRTLASTTGRGRFSCVPIACNIFSTAGSLLRSLPIAVDTMCHNSLYFQQDHMVSWHLILLLCKKIRIFSTPALVFIY